MCRGDVVCGGCKKVICFNLFNRLIPPKEWKEKKKRGGVGEGKGKGKKRRVGKPVQQIKRRSSPDRCEVAALVSQVVLAVFCF